jgi:hypothetical protein
MGVNVVGGGSRRRIRSSARGTVPSASRPPAAAVRPAHPSYPRRRHSWGQVQCGHQDHPHPDPAQARPGGGGRSRAGGATAGSLKGGVAATRRATEANLTADTASPATAVAPQGRAGPSRSVEPRAVAPRSPRISADHPRRLSAPRPTICDGSATSVEREPLTSNPHPRAGRAPRRRSPGRAS